MGYRWIFIALGLALLTGCSTHIKPTNRIPESETLNTITGRYAYIGNPCTTEPCLPGMAYAVLAGDRYYYVTIDARWFSENRSWGGYTPELNDLVTVTGYVGEKKDVSGNPFYTIEAVSLQPAE